jgi:hypothetical protein
MQVTRMLERGTERSTRSDAAALGEAPKAGAGDRCRDDTYKEESGGKDPGDEFTCADGLLCLGYTHKAEHGTCKDSKAFSYHMGKVGESCPRLPEAACSVIADREGKDMGELPENLRESRPCGCFHDAGFPNHIFYNPHYVGVDPSKWKEVSSHIQQYCEEASQNSTNASADSAEALAVEDAENAQRSASAMATIARYAAAVAGSRKAQALYRAAKKAAQADRESAHKAAAVQAAKTALDAAKAEETAWKAAIASEKQAAEKAIAAERDAAAKDAAAQNASVAVKQAAEGEEAAEEALDKTRIMEEAKVDKAAAEAAAKKAQMMTKQAAEDYQKRRTAMKELETAFNEAKINAQLAHESMEQAYADEMHAA